MTLWRQNAKSHDCMEIPDIIIAIDGYSSTGKSSLARLVAKELGLLYLDSGALYRAVTLYAQEERLISRMNVISPDLAKELEGLDVHFGEGGTHIGDRLIEKQIRSMEVASQVSPIAAQACVRDYVDRKLHEFGAGRRIVMDGRDIGTTVFPDAEIKIFLTASEQVRAQRRYDEMVRGGAVPSMEDVVANLRERDYIDSHREVSPLRRADDAFVLDNSEMTLEQEVAWVVGLVRGKFGILEA